MEKVLKLHLLSTFSYRVQWGKHVHPQHRVMNTVPIGKDVVKEYVLPVVVTRDPFRWMRSMV
jgi:hypothetical protein